MQLPVSGAGWQSDKPDVYQYRSDQAGSGDYRQPLNVDKHGYPVYTSASRMIVYTGVDTWNTDGYDGQYNNLSDREPIPSSQPRVIVNYVANNPSDSMAATPIKIADYALSTGLIYVGPNSGNWGGIQVGRVTPGANNEY
jgi:hypothetical protein